MFKIRIGLLIIGLFSIVAMIFIGESNLRWDDKLTFGYLNALLFASSMLFLGITFFGLDEEGKVPVGSLLYRCLSWFYRETQTTPDGRKVFVVKVPEKLRACPTHAMIYLGLLLGSAVCGFISYVGYMFWSGMLLNF